MHFLMTSSNGSFETSDPNSVGESLPGSVSDVRDGQEEIWWQIFCHLGLDEW